MKFFYHVALYYNISIKHLQKSNIFEIYTNKTIHRLNTQKVLCALKIRKQTLPEGQHANIDNRNVHRKF